MKAILETFTRPNGKPYKPRVLRTHDFQLAHEIASRQADWHELDPERAYQSWWRLVPFDKFHSGYDQTWIEDAERGVPCVVFPPL